MEDNSMKIKKLSFVLALVLIFLICFSGVMLSACSNKPKDDLAQMRQDYLRDLYAQGMTEIKLTDINMLLYGRFDGVWVAKVSVNGLNAGCDVRQDIIADIVFYYSGVLPLVAYKGNTRTFYTLQTAYQNEYLTRENLLSVATEYMLKENETNLIEQYKLNITACIGNNLFPSVDPNLNSECIVQVSYVEHIATSYSPNIEIMATVNSGANTFERTFVEGMGTVDDSYPNYRVYRNFYAEPNFYLDEGENYTISITITIGAEYQTITLAGTVIATH
jgi:hypothetical protein